MWLGCFYSTAFKKNNLDTYTEAVSYDRSFFPHSMGYTNLKNMPFDMYDFCFFYILQLNVYNLLLTKPRRLTLSVEVYTAKVFYIYKSNGKSFLYILLRGPKVAILKWLFQLYDSAESATF